MRSKFKELGEVEITYDILGEDAWGALLRMNGTSAGIVRRILHWLSLDPSSLETEDLQCLLRQEISALGSIKFLNPEPWLDTVHHALKGPDAHNSVYRGPDPQGVGRFIKTMRFCFQELADPNRGIVEIGPLKCTFFVSKRGKNPAFSNELTNSATLHNLIDEAIHTVLKSLQACGGLITHCPECKKMFLADRINQVYCTVTCQNRATSRSWNLKHKESQNGKKSKAKKSTEKKK